MAFEIFDSAGDSTGGVKDEEGGCGSLVKAQASARVDVPTVSFFFCSADHGVHHVCKVFFRMLGCQATDRDLERVSAVRR